MAEEKLTLIDGMSASLRRIYQEIEKLNRRMLSLKTNIKSLENPMSLSYLRRELKETEKQINKNEVSLKSMARAEALNEKYKAFTVGANGAYYLNGIRVAKSQMEYMASSYVSNVENGLMRRNRLLWETGRLGIDEKVAKLHPFRTAFNQVGVGINRLDKSLSELSRITNNAGARFYQLASSGLLLSYVFNRIASLSNDVFLKPQSQYVGNITRIALTNDKSKTPTEMMDSLYETASRTRAPIDATLMLYNRIALSGVKASNERIRRFVESFNKVTAISGTTGQENRAVMLQLAQGMGSNRLGGDEFRSISEQAPLFKYMLAKGLGVNPGALKEMGAQGKLTAEAIMRAMEKVQGQIDLIFKEAPLTIDQTITILQNEWSRLINKQFTGYIAIRDLIKDITLWMKSPEGHEVMTEIIRGWNRALYETTMFVRRHGHDILNNVRSIFQFIKTSLNWLKPVFNWCIDHARILFYWFLAIKAVILGIRGAIVTCRFIEWLNGGTQAAVALKSALVGVNKALLITLGEIGAVILAILGAWKLGVKIAEWKQSQDEKKALMDVDMGMLDQHMREWQKKNGMKPGQKVMTEEQYQAYQTEKIKTYNAMHQGIQKYLDNYYLPESSKYKKDFETAEANAKLSLAQIGGITGMADSSKNAPMVPNVGKVKEVGKINDAVSIDNDGIEMMKAIAERQWVMRNEVQVPQNVNIQVHKEADIDEDKLAESLLSGTKLAIASSMRGTPQVC